MISLHELYATGKSIREIARITGHARNTVRKYLRANGIPEPRYGKKRGSKLDPFKPLIDQSMAQGIFNCEVLLRLLRDQGYTGGITLIKGLCKAAPSAEENPCRATIRNKTWLPGASGLEDLRIRRFERGSAQDSGVCDGAGVFPDDVHRVCQTVRHPQFLALPDPCARILRRCSKDDADGPDEDGHPRHG